ncbi:hypothetical protein D3C72_1245450 [compost metagenome]
MIQGMQFSGTEKFAALLVAHEGVGFPRVPQPFGYVEVFAGNAVTQAVFRMFGAREIFRGSFQRRGDNVPARPAFTQVIEAGELASHGKRIAVGGG